MSYIRSTSNPEGLYILGTHRNVEFHKGEDFIGHMPQEIFNVLIDNYVDSYGEDCEFHDASVREIFSDGSYVMRLMYEDWYIDMWDVTWYFIAHSNYGRSKSKCKQKRIKRIAKI